MSIYAETWPEIRARHSRELIELIAQYAADYTIYETANILSVDRHLLRRYAHYYGFKFKRKHEAEIPDTRPRGTISLFEKTSK